MPAHSLPEDLNDWPTDHYELLGVSRNVSPRDLRRAYTRLIRTFKPEQYPEHFRRIREAFDALLQYAQWFGATEDEPAPPTDDSDNPTQFVHQTDAAPDPVEQPDAPPPAPRPDEELETLWRDAVAERSLAVYRRFAELNQQHAGKGDIYLRLYWLLTLDPDLDPQRSPCDWLVQGLLSSGFFGPLRQLYREEVNANPIEALTGRFQELLFAESNPGTIADLAEWRFQAALKRGQLDVLEDDLQVVGPRLHREDDKVWLRLIFSLVDHLVWLQGAKAARILETCTKAIRAHEYLLADFAYAFDRFDLVQAAALGRHKLLERREIPNEFVDIIPDFCTHPFAAVRPHLLELLEQITRDRPGWLANFDTIHKVAPAMLALFGQMLDRFAMDLGVTAPAPCPRQLIDELARDFIGRNGSKGYAVGRTAILYLCLREAVSPEQLADVVAEFTGPWAEIGTTFAQSLRDDWPLRYLYRAYQLFWM